MIAKDLVGQKFGRLTVLSFCGRDSWGKSLWQVECSCGTVKTVSHSNMKFGKHKSCGCWIREITAKRSTKHGHSSGIKKTTTYNIWSGMKQRCSDPNRKDYYLYGGVGVSVCKRWSGNNGFKNFLKDMGPRPYNLSIDRINPFKGYYPSNCRWADSYTQANNKRFFKPKLLEY